MVEMDWPSSLNEYEKLVIRMNTPRFVPFPSSVNSTPWVWIFGFHEFHSQTHTDWVAFLKKKKLVMMFRKKKNIKIFSLILLHIAKFRCRAFLSCSLILIWIIVDLFGVHSRAIFHRLFLNFFSARNWFFQQHRTSIFNSEFPLLSFLEKLS